MSHVITAATELASWLRRDAMSRGELEASLSDRGVPLELTVREMRLALGDRALSQAASSRVTQDRVDPLCEQGVIPEIPARDLDVEIVRRGVRGNGALIVRRLLDEDVVDRLSTAGRSAVVASRRRGRSMRYHPVDASRSSRDRSGLRRFVESSGGVLLADSPETLELLVHEYSQCGLLEVIRAYLGGTALLSGAKATVRSIAPSVDAELGWHQDGAFLGSGIGALNVWVALTDCGVDAPTMMMVPKRLDQIVPVGGVDAAFDWSVGATAVAEASEGCDPVVLQFAAGDAILFDEMNLHRTFTNRTMSSTRLAIESWFFAPDRMPDGWAALAV